MIKTGIVMCITNKKAGIMTPSGEFVYIKISKVLPKVGQIHTGQLYKKTLFQYKYAITAASLMFVLISSTFAHAYYSPVTTIVVSINPSVSLKANRWNKIISSKALNSGGSAILNNIKLKNKSIDSGLELLVKEAKAENFINDEYINAKQIISVDINASKGNSIDISNFKNIIDNNNLNIIINASSRTNKKIDITVNNTKIDTSTLNQNSHKQESINKNEDTKKNLLKKPSVDINNNKIENKSSKIKKEFKKNDKSSQIKEKIKNSDKPIKGKDDKIKEHDKSKNKNPNNNSSNIKKNIVANKVKKNLQNKKIKSVEITDDDSSKNHSFQTDKKYNSDKRSNSYENPQKTDNALNKFLKDFKN